MKEIEVKVLDINKKLIEDRLTKLGAKKISDGLVNSWHYDFPDEKIKNNSDHLRIRQEGGHSFITFKSPISRDHAKIMEELETDIQDIKTMDELGIHQSFLSHSSVVSEKYWNNLFKQIFLRKIY